MNAQVPGATLLSASFGGAQLVIMRRAVDRAAAGLGLDEVRRQDLVLAVGELITNAVRHGGGRGRLELWVSQGRLWFRVSDEGPGMAVAVPAVAPPASIPGGRGLWIARQVTEQMQLSTGPDGTTIECAIALPDHPG